MPADTKPPANSPKEYANALARARQAWLAEMEEHKLGPGMVRMRQAAELRPEHVAGCTVTAGREQLLGLLPKRGAVAEVGVDEGRFSRVILDTVKPKTLHLIDTRLPQETIGEKFADELASGVVQLHEGLSWDMLKAVPDATLDFAYIDADHRYQSVSRDIAAAVKKIKPNGYLVFNDYTYWSPLECMKYGVVEAVNEFLVRHEGWRIAYLSLSPRMYCDVALHRESGK